MAAANMSEMRLPICMSPLSVCSVDGSIWLAVLGFHWYLARFAICKSQIDFINIREVSNRFWSLFDLTCYAYLPPYLVVLKNYEIRDICGKYCPQVIRGLHGASVLN